jgi:hypothetical protein
VTKADHRTLRQYQIGGPAIRRRGIDRFRTLAVRGGWKISRPFSDNVALIPQS